tara:strand:- start:176 stop:676 length:501 start_codon:yes stop_codon:yes gene_type:complete
MNKNDMYYYEKIEKGHALHEVMKKAKVELDNWWVEAREVMKSMGLDSASSHGDTLACFHTKDGSCPNGWKKKDGGLWPKVGNKQDLSAVESLREVPTLKSALPEKYKVDYKFSLSNGRYILTSAHIVGDGDELFYAIPIFLLDHVNPGVDVVKSRNFGIFDGFSDE